MVENSSVQQVAPSESELLSLPCPSCTSVCNLSSAHIGVQGQCPVCSAPIVAQCDSAGEVSIILLSTPSAEAGAQPADDQAQATAAEAGKTNKSSSSLSHVALAMVGGGATLILLVLAYQYFFGPPSDAELADAKGPVAVPVSPVPPVQPVVTEAPPVDLAKPDDAARQSDVGNGLLPIQGDEQTDVPPGIQAEQANYALSAQATLREFLSKNRSWEKLLHVLEPEDSLLAILEFNDAGVASGETPVRHLKTNFETRRRGWVSRFEFTEKDGRISEIQLVHQPDGSSKVDFMRYWRERGTSES